MNNTNSIYGMFNANYIQQQAMELQLRQFENDQHYKIAESIRKLDDFMKSTMEIAPQYRSNALAAYFNVYIKYNNMQQ